ncbi:MAG TPA: hypothetical protein VJ201_05495 [Candidatus Babeliales bacterium]|nr:hypothetical protein [Candidatus Babeliales bacterium]
MKIKTIFLFLILGLFLGNSLSIYSMQQAQEPAVEAEYICEVNNDCPHDKPFCNLEGICVECDYVDGNEFIGCQDDEICLGYKCERL